MTGLSPRRVGDSVAVALRDPANMAEVPGATEGDRDGPAEYRRSLPPLHPVEAMSPPSWPPHRDAAVRPMYLTRSWALMQASSGGIPEEGGGIAAPLVGRGHSSPSWRRRTFPHRLHPHSVKNQGQGGRESLRKFLPSRSTTAIADVWGAASSSASRDPSSDHAGTAVKPR